MFNINNSACFIGTLEDAPKIAKEQDGATVATFTLACRDNFLKRDGSASIQYLTMVKPVPEDDADTMELVKSMKKGGLFGVSAALSGQSWTDGDGYDHREMKIVADTIVPMGN